MMSCGCTPSSTNGLASRRNSPARSTTVVVPSPTCAGGKAGQRGSRGVERHRARRRPTKRRASESWLLAMSTSVLAAGCTMSSSCGAEGAGATGRQRERRRGAQRAASPSAAPRPLQRRRAFIIVAPSLEIVVPRASCTSLSMPSGPCARRRASNGSGRKVTECRPRPAPPRAAPHQRGAHGVHHGAAGVDVADQLRLALARIRAFPEQHDLRLLHAAPQVSV